MNLSEAAAFRELKEQVESLKRQVAELTRRLDDFSKAERAKAPERETLKLKNG